MAKIDAIFLPSDAERPQTMDEVKALHHRFHKAVEEERTKECFAVISLLSFKSCHEEEESFLDRYSHARCPYGLLMHAVGKRNARVALHLLERGCSPNITIDHCSNGRRQSVPLCFKFLFKVIGKPSFETVVMRILESTKELIIDENANTVLHLVCQKKLTSWLKIISSSLTQQHLFFCANNQGYLPMHVAAKNNFVEFFDIVFNNVSLSQTRFIAANSKSVESEGSLSLDSGKKCNGETTRKPSCHGGDCLGSESVTRTKIYHKNDRRGKVRGQNKPEEVCKGGSSKTNGTCQPTTLMGLYGSNLNINTPLLGRGITVVHIAAQYKFQKLLKLLLSMGANSNGCDGQSYSPLFSCLISSKSDSDIPSDDGLFDVCRHLISAGANVNEYYLCQCFKSTVDDDVVTPLHLAAKFGCKRIIQLLLNNGADAKANSKKLHKLPVQLALEEIQTESALILLDKDLYPDGLLMDFADNALNTLSHSAGNCDEVVVAQLIRLGCSFDRPNINNVFPLDKAIFYGNIPYIHSILSTQPHVLNLWRRYKACPPLHLAASSSYHHLPLCQILLSHGADIYAKAYGKTMAYRRALRTDSHENVAYLCELMSHPFTVSERKELLECSENRMDNELAVRLKSRLENIPSLLSHCLDVVRQVFISNDLNFIQMNSLPIPCKIISALKYENNNV